MGKMGLLHSAIVNVLPGSELACISESNALIRKTAQSLSKNIKFYKDYREMLDREKPDYAFITTPPGSHVAMAADCISRGIPFFVEKPLSLNAEMAAPLLASLQSSPTINMVGFMLRYMPTFAALKAHLGAEGAGEPVYFNASTYVSQMFRRGRGWRFSRSEAGGGVLMGQAVHAVDLIVWYLGMPTYVSAQAAAPYSGDVEDFGHVMLSWGSGLKGWLDSSWSVDNHRLLETRVSVTTTKGTVTADDDHFTLFQRPEEYGGSGEITVRSRADLFHGAAVDIGGTHYTDQDEAFLNAVRTGKSPQSDVPNAFKVQQIMDAVYRSIDLGGEPVNVQDPRPKRSGFWGSLWKVAKGARL